MFDDHSKKQNQNQGINLLPLDMKKSTLHARPAKEPMTIGRELHVPAKEPKIKTKSSLPDRPVKQKVSAPHPSFFTRLKSFFDPKIKNHTAAVVAVNDVKITPHIAPPITPSPQPVLPKVKITPPPVKAPEKKDGFNEVGITPKEDLEPSLEVNLLPARPKGFTDSQIIWSYFFIFIISALVIFSPYIYFKSNNNRYAKDISLLTDRLSLVDQKITQYETEIKNYGSLAQQFNNLGNLFDNHIYWSQFFPTLENHTAGNVYFNGLSATDLGEIGLTGKALDLRSLAEQLVVLTSSPVYHDVQMSAPSFVEAKNPGDPTVTFDLSFILPHTVIENQNKINNPDPTK